MSAGILRRSAPLMRGARPTLPLLIFHMTIHTQLLAPPSGLPIAYCRVATPRPPVCVPSAPTRRNPLATHILCAPAAGSVMVGQIPASHELLCCRYLYDILRKVLHAPIYLDSSTLPGESKF